MAVGPRGLIVALSFSELLLFGLFHHNLQVGSWALPFLTASNLPKMSVCVNIFLNL